MFVQVASRRRKLESINKEFPGSVVLDVTSRAPEPWVQLSPFYPHGGIPVPFTPRLTGASVEGIWQALKVFDRADVDPAKLTVTTMTGLKRTVRRFGPVRGHRAGLHGETLLDYRTARRDIYLPSYRWMLEHRAAHLITDLRRLAEHRLVLLDYTVNGNIDDESSPLSHAALIAQYLTGRRSSPSEA